jgi:hypothetical protein
VPFTDLHQNERWVKLFCEEEDRTASDDDGAIEGSASTTARSKILLQSPKFLSSNKISLPHKRWKKSRKFRQFEPNVS